MNTKYIVTEQALPEILVLDPSAEISGSEFSYESFSLNQFRSCTGLDVNFVQDNHSKSAHNVLRGLHYQIKSPHGKLIRVSKGTVFDVAVDLRRSSKNFMKWVGTDISEQNKRQIWIPAGFAHGFLVVSEFAEVIYKTTGYWQPEHERILLWSDPNIGVRWPLDCQPILSSKDAAGKSLAESDVFE